MEIFLLLVKHDRVRAHRFLDGAIPNDRGIGMGNISIGLGTGSFLSNGPLSLSGPRRRWHYRDLGNTLSDASARSSRIFYAATAPKARRTTESWDRERDLISRPTLEKHVHGKQKQKRIIKRRISELEKVLPWSFATILPNSAAMTF